MSMKMTHEPAAQRFVAITEGQESVVDYQLSGNTMTITHTGVPSDLRGRGIAGKLTTFALDTAREKGWKVVPVCSYAESFFKRNPAYKDLLA